MKLEDLKNNRNLNITQLARLTGYSRSHVQGVVCGRFKAGKKFVLALDKISIDEVNKWDELRLIKERPRCELCGCIKKQKKASL